MHLFELCGAARSSAGASVPAWAMGCFRRRSITFYTGTEDATTEVIWLQSRGLTADFRRTPPPVHVAGPAAVAELPPSQQMALARVEGGLGRTRWDGELMHWSDWAAFQNHTKWPEPGRLARVGSSLIELAPSGAYVEDWRFQPLRAGPLIGLGLIEERDARTGTLLHRGGGLVICGEHAGFVRGRPEPLPDGVRLEDFVREHAGDAAALARVFGCDAAYGLASATPDGFTVALATLPWREGEPLLSLEGFELQSDGLLSQRVEEGGRWIERRFTIDTLEPDFRPEVATAAPASTVEWFEGEVRPLLATLP